MPQLLNRLCQGIFSCGSSLGGLEENKHATRKRKGGQLASSSPFRRKSNHRHSCKYYEGRRRMSEHKVKWFHERKKCFPKTSYGQLRSHMNESLEKYIFLLSNLKKCTLCCLNYLKLKLFQAEKKNFNLMVARRNVSQFRTKKATQ